MVATNYAWNPVFDCITEETSDAGVITVEYTQEPKLYGGLISQHRVSTSSFYHYDAIGTTRALTNSSQTVSDAVIYTAFGEKVASTGATLNPFGFVGALGYYVAEVSQGLSVRWRTLSTVTSRWLSLDPLGFNSALNMYAYVDQRPTILFDPSGLQAAPRPISPKQCEDAISACKKTASYRSLEIGIRRRQAQINRECNSLNAQLNIVLSGRYPFWPYPPIGPIEQPLVILYYTKLLSDCMAKLERCSIPPVVCLDFCIHNVAAPPGQGIGGGFNPENGEIYICRDRCFSSQDAQRTCVHEMVHALDYCYGAKLREGSIDCNDLICSELRAYSATDICDNPADRNPGETREQCIIRRALGSVIIVDDCSHITAPDVARLSRRCIIRGAPFGRRPIPVSREF